MAHPALFPKRIPVIGRQDDDALVVQPARLQVVDEGAQTRVEPANREATGA